MKYYGIEYWDAIGEGRVYNKIFETREQAEVTLEALSLRNTMIIGGEVKELTLVRSHTQD